jgi:membrane fusion protein (multidrug efflux system)
VVAHAESVPLKKETVGILSPVRIAEVSARVAGIVLRQVYTEGTDVKAGDVLFTIDPAPLKAALHIEEAALTKAKADAVNAALIAKRYKNLAAKNALSSQDLDTALANERTTAASVKAAQANLEKVKLDLGYATVTAPISGRAGRALVSEGALVGKNTATHMTTVEQIDPIFLNFSIPVTALQKLQQPTSQDKKNGAVQNGDKVEIIMPDNKVYPLPGIVDFSDQSVDPQTGTVALRADVPNPDHKLLPGMFVKIRFIAGHIDSAFLLPQATVQRDKAGAYVLVVDASGKVEQRRVETHGMTRTDWIVSGNLASGDQVIVDGLQKARPGGMVKAAPVATKKGAAPERSQSGKSTDQSTQKS